MLCLRKIKSPEYSFHPLAYQHTQFFGLDTFKNKGGVYLAL
jgi:hypothetical protein